MPVSYTITYHRNHNSSDTTTKSYTQSVSQFTLKTIDEIGWEAPTGYTFSAWNTAADGSGMSRTAGQTGSSAYPWYAIWEQLPAVTYTTTSTELTSVADAIRAKGGTSASLEWPSGFAQAIADIPSGGGGGMVIAVTMTNSGSTFVYTLDKTVGEITSALSEGISPLFSYIDGTGLRYYVMETALFTSSNSRLYIKSNGWTMNFSASGVDAYPSFTQSGGSND